MLKKCVSILLFFIILTGCASNQNNAEPPSEADFPAKEAHEIFNCANQTLLNNPQQYIHNVTSINMGNPETSPDSVMSLNVDFTADKKTENNHEVADIKVVSTSNNTTSQLEGKLTDDVFTYSVDGEEYTENISFDQILQDGFVYNIDFLSEYVQHATITSDLQNFRQINVTIDNKYGKDFIRNCLPELENHIDLEGDMNFDNICIEYTTDENNNLLDFTFNLQLTFINAENEIPYSVNIYRNFNK